LLATTPVQNNCSDTRNAPETIWGPGSYAVTTLPRLDLGIGPCRRESKRKGRDGKGEGGVGNKVQKGRGASPK